jgi:diguanylate cyclase
MSRLEDTIGALLAAVESLAEAARADDKTPLLNALALNKEVEVALGDLEQKFVVVFGDINRFKTLNSLHGHAGGDAAINRVGTILKQIAEACEGLAFRQAGDEFVALIPRTMIATFGQLAKDRLSRAVCKHDGREIEVGISFGYAVPGDEDARSVLRKAEDACRLAKLNAGSLVEWTVETSEKLPFEFRAHCNCGTQFDCAIPREAKQGELRCPNCHQTIEARANG